MSHTATLVTELTVLDAGDLPRVRGDLEGAGDAAHAADVGHERDSRDRDRRRDRSSPASPHQDTLVRIIGFVAVVLASANVVGGFVVTDRMLEMFKKREPPKKT